MRVGVPKETKDNEFRVGLIPSTVRELTAKGHAVLVERAVGACLADADYETAGAKIAPDAASVFAQAEPIREGEGAARRRAAAAEEALKASL